MKKINIDGVIVVEGKEDVSYLSSFLNALFFITNGLDINKEKIDFLKRASEKNKIIVMTDNDPAGETIKKKIKQEINAIFELKISGKARNNYKKHGVAESEKEEILKELKPFIIDKAINQIDYDLISLISLSDNPSDKREQIIAKYRLIHGNNKSLENQLNILGISKEKLWK